MGLMQRRKGKEFERKVAARLRETWPEAIVRRASQAERADNPDVFVEGGPSILARLWLELEDAKSPRSLDKLEQAEGNAALWWARRGESVLFRLPIVVWHRLAERTIWATTRLWIVDVLRGRASDGESRHVVTLAFDDLVLLLQRNERESS